MITNFRLSDSLPQIHVEPGLSQAKAPARWPPLRNQFGYTEARKDVLKVAFDTKPPDSMGQLAIPLDRRRALGIQRIFSPLKESKGD